MMFEHILIVVLVIAFIYQTVKVTSLEQEIRFLESRPTSADNLKIDAVEQKLQHLRNERNKDNDVFNKNKRNCYNDS